MIKKQNKKGKVMQINKLTDSSVTYSLNYDMIKTSLSSIPNFSFVWLFGVNEEHQGLALVLGIDPEDISDNVDNQMDIATANIHVLFLKTKQVLSFDGSTVVIPVDVDITCTPKTK